ncbi:ribonuclease H2, subunit B [Spinellus fusiger]|nr:ribonuclease H2, subunit B [Spinellus fusiger]
MSQIVFSHKRDQDLEQLCPLRLPCPRSGQWIPYLFSENQQLYELQQVTGPGRKACWLIENTTYKNGGVRLLTLVDPLFIALTFLEKAYHDSHSYATYRKLEDILSKEYATPQPQEDEEEEQDTMMDDRMDDRMDADAIDQPLEESGLDRLAQLKELKAGLHYLCDSQDVGGGLFTVYRFNQEKTMLWLHRKVDQLVRNFHTIPLLMKSVEYECMNEDGSSISEEAKNVIYQREAIHLLAKYLTEAWFDKLLASYNLSRIPETVAVSSQPTVSVQKQYKTYTKNVSAKSTTKTVSTRSTTQLSKVILQAY